MRKKQYHKDGKTLWQSLVEGVRCKCGGNVFHKELDMLDGKIYYTCNACGQPVGQLKPELAQKALEQSVWKLEGLEDGRRFDVVLFKKEPDHGLCDKEIIDILRSIKTDELLPAEFKGDGSSALGAVTYTASEHLDHDLSALGIFVSGILNDMEKESPDGIYDFRELKIRLTR